MSVTPLPRLMVAPNGARRTKADHPALPVTVAETVAVAEACFAAGAGGLHAHVRDGEGRHVLDAGLYRELVGEMDIRVPGMAVQITTEAVGRYSPEEQRAVVRAVMPDMVSVALAEMIPDPADVVQARRFYHWANEAGIAVQHIVYAPDQVVALGRQVSAGVIPRDDLQVLFVLGRYTEGQQSNPDDLKPFRSALASTGLSAEWALCAFGQAETDCLLAALAACGNARCGFENSLWNRDGSLARDNVERIAEVVRLGGLAG
ncbi:class III aminotransferase [Zhengella mangrovi]|uniref:Class III aminotransferase n=1 Tax=Zhengella mangrovi TaxID=1982044 RepID=A0A2G1QLP2_9HYPH|nr:3-keto-5-aminohexanoate cleavage protein [Zhengella mangrovi]PHP66389.1 class III aminotransferase [Zhengella mangrovi]